MPSGLRLLIAAQFFSAVADNALLIVTMAVLHERGMAPWWAPLLKFAFTISYVVLAPFVGALADAWPKARLMGWMNGVKIAGAIALLVGAHPVAAFAVVGFGAAAYAPAKYGLTTELVPPERLVAANGMLEVSVVCAVLLGTALGGALTGAVWFDSAVFDALAPAVAALGPWTREPLDASLTVVLAFYALASVVNVGVPDSGVRYPAAAFHPRALWREFRVANRTLWHDREGGLSLAVTTIFWGVGATLQFVVLRWAADVLELPLDRAAYLQLAVAVGVMIGAAAAGRFVALAQAHRMLVFGVAFGLAMPLVALVDRVLLALPLLVLAGVLGGALIVPLNALLQHRGCTLLSAGRSIAVQGFNENASILLLLGIYAGLVALDVSIVTVMAGLGFAVAAAVWGLMRRARRVWSGPASERRAFADSRR